MIKQPGFFDHTQEDLPLFSGTAPRVKGERFDPKPEVKQEAFFDMRPQFNDEKKERELKANYNYTHKTFKGQLVSTDFLIEPMSLEDHQREIREKLIASCKEANIELELNEPYPLHWPDGGDQIRSNFWVRGKYPEWYFYQTVNKAKPCPLDRI
jgi:hypothetical protein